MRHFHDNMTIGAARDVLRPLAEAKGPGAECPVCRRLTKVRRRKLNSGMAHSLIVFYREHADEWGFAPDMFGYGNEFTRLRLWGFIEEQLERRDDGGRAGWWRLTPAGERFVRCETTVLSHVHVYAARALKFDGQPITIRDALGSPFNYRELMEDL